MLNLLKIDVYNFKYKIRVGNIIKLFFLSHKPMKMINIAAKAFQAE